MEISPAVKRETAYIALWTLVLSLLMQAVFLLIRMWDMSVLSGNLLGGAASILNFFLMGLTVQRAVGQDEKKAALTVKLSQSLRMLMLFAVAAIGALLPVFNVYAVLVTLLFPRIAIAIRPLFDRKRKNDETD